MSLSDSIYDIENLASHSDCDGSCKDSEGGQCTACRARVALNKINKVVCDEWLALHKC